MSPIETAGIDSWAMIVMLALDGVGPSVIFPRPWVR